MNSKPTFAQPLARRCREVAVFHGRPRCMHPANVVCAPCVSKIMAFWRHYRHHVTEGQLSLQICSGPARLFRYDRQSSIRRFGRTALCPRKRTRLRQRVSGCVDNPAQQQQSFALMASALPGRAYLTSRRQEAQHVSSNHCGDENTFEEAANHSPSPRNGLQPQRAITGLAKRLPCMKPAPADGVP